MIDRVETLVEKILGTENEPITPEKIDLAILKASVWLQELTTYRVGLTH